MNALKLSTNTLIALALMIGLMIITRSNGPFSGLHLADFTIPALFIAGVYYRQWIVPVILIVAAIAIDNFVIVYQGVSANCITPAYTLMPLFYLMVYWGAKKINSLAIQNVKQLFHVSAVVVTLTALQWLLATSSYYAFTTAKWSNFPAYAMQWSFVEIPPVLYWMVVISIVFTINKKLSLIRYFKTTKS